MSKPESATKRIKRLLDVLSSYTFHLYYFKGKDMVLSDFLSRIEGDKNYHHEVISISFNFHSILTGHIYIFFKLPSETHGVVTRSQMKAVGTQMPKVHGADKVVDPALKPEAQAREEGIPKPTPVLPKSVSWPHRIIPPVLPRKGQGRPDVRRNTIRTKSQPIPQLQSSPAPPTYSTL